MIMLILGIIDLAISILLGLMIYGISIKIVSAIAVIAGIYLIGKGAVFISFASIIDIFAGIVLIASYFFTVPGFLLSIAALLLLQKAIFSFL